MFTLVGKQAATLHLFGYEPWLRGSDDGDDADGCSHALSGTRSRSEDCDDALGCSHGAGLWTLDIGALMCWTLDTGHVDPEEGAGCNHALASERGPALEMCDSRSLLFPCTGGEGVAASAAGLGRSHFIACKRLLGA